MIVSPLHDKGEADPLQRAFRLAIACILITQLIFPVAAARDVKVALPELRPMMFTAEQGEPAGLFVDIITDIGKKEGWNIVWVRGTHAESWDRLAAGEIDLMMGVAETPERQALYDFNQEPVLSAWSQVYASSRSGINRILDLDGKRVVLLKGDINGIAFRDLAEKFGLNITYIEKNSLDEIFAGTAAGEADAVVAFSLAGEQSANKYGLLETPVMFNPTSLVFAAPKAKNQDLLQAIDRYLVQAKGDPSSTYSRAIQKWFGMKADWVIPAYIWWSLAAAAGVAVLFVIMSVILRREVHKKTEEILRQNEELHAAYEQLTATEESLRENFRVLEKSENALMQARKKLNVLNSLTFQDLQNGIFSLSGFIQLAQAAGCSGDAQARLKKGEEILRSVAKSLEVSKKYQNLGISQPKWQNVKHVLLNAISHLDFSKIARDVDLPDLEIFADPLLEDVFLTLLENVVLHGAAATRISLQCRQNPNSITIVVSDNGPGIPAAEKESIFLREYAGKSATSLFLAREILSITNISIRETGEPGSGARFEITVPKGEYRINSP